MSFSFTRSVSFASFFSSQFTHVSSSSRSSLERRRSHRSSSSSNRARISITNASNPTDEEKEEEKDSRRRRRVGRVGRRESSVRIERVRSYTPGRFERPNRENRAKDSERETVRIRRERIWKDYPNINHLVSHTLELREDEVFTEFTRSSFLARTG